MPGQGIQGWHANIRIPKVVQQKFDSGKSENSTISKRYFFVKLENGILGQRMHDMQSPDFFC